MLRDLRFALRMLGKGRALTATAILTLAVGIAANTALFSAANTLLLRPLPYGNAGRVLLVQAVADGSATSFSVPRFTFLVEHSRSFARIAAFTNETFNISGRGDPEQLSAARVSWDFLDTLGIAPVLGRGFKKGDDEAGGGSAVLISHRLWAQRFGSQRGAVGESITLDSRPYTVIGVMPAGFEFSLLGEEIDIWAPKVDELNLVTAAQVRAGAGYLSAVALLKTGVPVKQAQAEMDVLNREYVRAFPKMADADPTLTIAVTDLQREVVANVRPALLILFAAVGMLLLIGCGNVATLLLSRSLARTKEIAVRRALGAGRATIVRQLLTESTVLASIGGAIGMLLSVWGTRTLSNLLQGEVPRVREIGMDWRVLAFTAAISLLAGLLFGMAPALHASRGDLNALLRSEGRGMPGGARPNALRGVLVAAQVALSMVLLIGSGLLVRSFVRLQNVTPGFDPRNILTMNIALPPARYATGQQMAAFYDRVVAEAGGLPGVRSAAAVSALPVNARRFSPVLVEGQPAVALAGRPILEIVQASPGYIRTMRIPLLRGREFTAEDDAQHRRVALVNASLVRRFWPREDAIGKRLLLGRMTEPTEVVGVVGDVKNVNLAADTKPAVYLPFAQLPWPSMNLVIRTAVEPHTLVQAVRQRVLSVDRDQPITSVRSMEEVLAEGTKQRRFLTYLLVAFAVTALLLAIAGIYGMVAFSVAQRTRELGIRIALGADRMSILRSAAGTVLKFTLAGIALGLGGALASGRLLSSLLFEVTGRDPLAYGASAVLFFAVAGLAGYFPARKAARLDPSQALRHE